ncbi:replication fork protection component Swi3-domain-containing protein [Triangularia setosa]|uniref:Chromosome segregation in meiosis protein n=1 Tax=Triangularia setosa TaxID=2587417 RepID=A0AAN6W4D7_9PEZI|nr:replication fork protection component Swi3-domain-containing protein [Podospora setosa]
MPAVADSSKAIGGNKKDSSAFVDSFLEGWSDFDENDPFGSPRGDKSKKADDKKADTNSKKRKGADVLGLETEVDKKKARVPRVKLDDARLLSDKGIPWLRKNAQTKLKLKGKGHEFSDAARVLSFYQEWLDELFPKASFLDALTMVEKAGHKTSLRNARMKWIDELKPRGEGEGRPNDEDPFPIYEHDKTPKDTGRIAPVFDKTKERQKTPDGDGDLFGDDDIYNATPRAATNRAGSGGVPDDDDLDALMAEAEANSGPLSRSIFGDGSGSIFGNGTSNNAAPALPRPQANDIPDDDDLDALMAEAEAETPSNKPNQPTKSIFGDGKPQESVEQTKVVDDLDDDDDFNALMAEIESAKAPSAPQPTEPSKGANNGDKDDLDALMAEAEAEGAPSKPAPAPVSENPTEVGAQKETSFDDDEAAMAEMDGLW